MTDAAVLLYGETGAGKDVIARQIHLFSQRKGPFVAVHPASTPEQLFESEFFGHEKGSFTGATSQKIGYFEMANGGTLFIDEVGEMPLSMQVKLLRVLQNKRFMRVGGTAEIISRFRLVAATNRDLRDEVAKGRFREDLFYRLSVVPLRVPPLRERREDIIGLAEAFAESYCQRYGRPSLRLTDAERACLLNYSWPGNVRELKNIIERAVILNAPLLELVSPSRATASGSGAGAFIIPDFPTIPELEERYLRYVLERTGGKVCGPDGAESLLRLKRSTIYLKLKKIRDHSFRLHIKAENGRLGGSSGSSRETAFPYIQSVSLGIRLPGKSHPQKALRAGSPLAKSRTGFHPVGPTLRHWRRTGNLQ